MRGKPNVPNRILRSKLLQSERFLDLKNNTHRLCYIVCVLEADDLGNFEANDRDLTRIWGEFGIDTTAKAAQVWDDLASVDLVRPYTVGRKRYGHLPRWRQRLRHYKHTIPRPPPEIECNEISALLGKTSDERQTDVRRTSDERQTDDGRASDVRRPEEKRSEVKRSEGKGRKAKDAPAAPSLPDWLDPGIWQDYLAMRTTKRAPNSARALGMAIRELETLRHAGYPPNSVLEQSIFRGWTALYPLKANGGPNGRQPDSREKVARELFPEDPHEHLTSTSTAPARDISGEATRVD